MLINYFYEGSTASTVEGYRERAEFARTLSAVLGGALAVMLALFVWSALTLFPLVDAHPALATTIVAIKTVGGAVIAATGLGLVAAVRSWRSNAAGAHRAR